MRRTCLPALLVGLILAGTARGGERSDTARIYQPPRRPAVPLVRDAGSVRNPIDTFILAKLEEKGLTLSRPADRLALLRRVTVDLTGLAPTVAAQDAFLHDDRPDAYERVVDRLLASPAFGERWAQHWLDLVRYAETDGFKADDLRPAAHRYRDWVIRACNADLPYDQFLRLQLAGDELAPCDPDALVATGLNRLWPDEYNAANLEQRRQEILDDVTDVTGLVFLGLTFGCARCHDHKYDPISQKDYFRLQAFFAPLLPRDDLPLAATTAQQAYRQRLAAWETATRDLRAEMEQLVADSRRERRRYALGKFRPEIQQAVLTPPDRRTPYQEQIAQMAEKQLRRAEQDAPKRLSPERKKRYAELQRQLAAVRPARPEAPAPIMAVTDVGTVGPPTHRLMGGDWRKPREELRPAFPAFLGGGVPDTSLPTGVRSTGRRAALARWLTRPDHPLTARVVVNRLWQHHFGRGLAGTPNDLGSQGEAPTHPELLDWLAVELVEKGWGLKHLHRLMVTSAAYRQDSRVDAHDPAHARAWAADRGNHLLWHAARRRLEGEALRDAVLALSSDLNRRMFGVSARPALPPGISKYAWKPDERAAERDRRSVYVFVRRNMRFPLFDAFDLPDLHNSCARRTTTTTAPQALLLLNGDFTRDQARRWADRLGQRGGLDGANLVARAYRMAWCRPATPEEVRLGVQFLATQTQAHLAGPGPSGVARDPAAAHTAAVADFCHALLNSNEFLYVD